MKPVMDLSIIIVNWRSLGDLQACLHSVQRETREITHEILVIDNASGDGSEAVICRDFPQVIFLQSERNLGFAAANNLAYRHSSGDIVAFLNPDTEIEGDVFTRMVAHLRRDPATGAVGARLLNTDGSLQTSCVQAYPTIWNQLVDSALLRRLFPAWRAWGSEALLSQTGQPCEVDAISGACFVVRREVFEHVGLFTETYFMYVEDLDLSYKISAAGYRICYLPDCCVTHHGGRSSAQQDPNFASLRQRESVLQFFEGTRGNVYSRCYRGTVAVSAAVRMALVILSVPLGPLVLRGNDRGALLRKWWAHLRWAIAVRPANARARQPFAIADPELEMKGHKL